LKKDEETKEPLIGVTVKKKDAKKQDNKKASVVKDSLKGSIKGEKKNKSIANDDDDFEQIENQEKKKKCSIPEMKSFCRQEALQLRKCFKFMPAFHVYFLLINILIYHGELFLLVADIGFIWLNLYNHRTLYKLTCAIHIGLLAIITLISLSHFQRVIEEWDGGLFFFFVTQVYICYPLCALITAKRLKAHVI